MSPWLRVRAWLDPVAAAVLGVVLLPVGAAIGAVVGRRDGRPVLIGLPRVGRGGRTFRMWKFRTMRAEAAGGRASGSPLTAAGDARITPTGAWLRGHRLDELPNLWNVLRGEMALVGPRPETPEYVVAGDPRWEAVLAARPGIAGPAQILASEWEQRLMSGADAEDTYRHRILPAKLSIDRWYVERATLWDDVLVLVALAQRVVGHADRTVVHRRVLANVAEAARLDEAATGPGPAAA